MATFSYGGSEPVEVAPENEAQFEAAGWFRHESEKPKKSEKLDVQPVE